MGKTNPTFHPRLYGSQAVLLVPPPFTPYVDIRLSNAARASWPRPFPSVSFSVARSIVVLTSPFPSKFMTGMPVASITGKPVAKTM